MRLYRSLQGDALGLRRQACPDLAGSPGPRRRRACRKDLVSVCSNGEIADALAYLRKQLGELRCVETEAEVVRARHGLSQRRPGRQGRRRRTPSPAGAHRAEDRRVQHRDRLKLLRDELEGAEQERAGAGSRSGDRQRQCVRELVPASKRPKTIARDVHGLMLAHREAVARYRSQLRQPGRADQPRPVRLSRAGARRSEHRRKELEELSVNAGRRRRAATGRRRDHGAGHAGRAEGQATPIARLAREAVGTSRCRCHPRRAPAEELDEREADLEERLKRCVDRARDNERPRPQPASCRPPGRD